MSSDLSFRARLVAGTTQQPPWARCLVVGEVAQAHDGSLGLAHAFIDAIASAGADAVKFQTHIADAESSPDEGWRTEFSEQDASRFDYWKRMEFSEEQWLGLRKHAEERDLVFLSSPFSITAAELLQSIGVTGWKVASGEVGNTLLLEHLAATGLPVMISSGMSPLEELDRAVATFVRSGCSVAVMQCTSSYPTPPGSVGLNVIREFRERYGCAVGLSDHSGTIYAGLAAATMGIDVLEVHVTMSRQMFGPDVAASVTTSELRQLAEGVRFIEEAMASQVDKDAVAADLEPMRSLFTKRLVASEDIPAGAAVEGRHLAARKPGEGIPPSRASEVIGRRVRYAMTAGEPFSFGNLEDADG
jgi:N,N'-diacetyllegionaminate synthase